MRILQVAEKNNPYPADFCQILADHYSAEIDFSIFNFWNVDFQQYDIIHFHWPAIITSTINAQSPYTYDKNIKSEIFLLSQALAKWKLKTKIVSTIHNLDSHNIKSEFISNIFRQVYENSDYIIHLGNKSVELIKEHYPPSISNIPSIIIPHSTYNSYPNIISKPEARTQYGISKNAFVVMVFGDIRNDTEKEFVLDTFRKIEVKNKVLLIARYRINPHLSRWKNYMEILKLKLSGVKIGIYNRYLNSEEVQYFFNATDVVLCQRINSLNSGIIPLAASFKRPIVGPRIGNIEEVLAASGCDSFASNDATEAAKVITQMAKSNDVEKRGLDLFDYASEHWSNEIVAEQHYALYQKLISE